MTKMLRACIRPRGVVFSNREYMCQSLNILPVGNLTNYIVDSWCERAVDSIGENARELADGCWRKVAIVYDEWSLDGKSIGSWAAQIAIEIKTTRVFRVRNFPRMQDRAISTRRDEKEIVVNSLGELNFLTLREKWKISLTIDIAFSWI